MSTQEHHLTQATHDRLSAEYQHLTTTWRIEIARKIEIAREMGDLSENGDYHAAKEEQGKVEARIGHLGALLENSVIISDVAVDEVGRGSIVTITYEGDDDEEVFLVGSIEEKQPGMGVISPESPLGSALLGARVGDAVTFEAPSGAMNVNVVAISA